MSRHSDAHGCVYTTKAACDRARLEALGKCVEMTADQKTPTQCSRWAQSIVDEKAMCNMHAGAVLVRADRARRAAERRAELDARITAHMERVRDHPSIWG